MRFDGDAVAAFVCIVGYVQGLMNIADQMDQKREVATCAKLLIFPRFEPVHVIVDLRRNAGSTRTTRRQIGLLVLQTDVDEVSRGS